MWIEYRKDNYLAKDNIRQVFQRFYRDTMLMRLYDDISNCAASSSQIDQVCEHSEPVPKQSSHVLGQAQCYIFIPFSLNSI